MIVEEAIFYPKSSEIKTSIGLNYHDQDILGKRFIWQVYIRRCHIVYHEKRKYIFIPFLLIFQLLT